MDYLKCAKVAVPYNRYFIWVGLPVSNISKTELGLTVLVKKIMFEFKIALKENENYFTKLETQVIWIT